MTEHESAGKALDPSREFEDWCRETGFRKVRVEAGPTSAAIALR
jgi:hypothetical protein